MKQKNANRLKTAALSFFSVQIQLTQFPTFSFYLFITQFRRIKTSTLLPLCEMGFPQNCSCSHQNRNLIVSFIFLLLWSFDAMTFPAQGRPIMELVEGAMEVEKRAAVIGSRPPRCERRCSYCGNCEAIQVPVTTRRKTRAAVFAREDDISNYKPISWKCKCGNLIFNP